MKKLFAFTALLAVITLTGCAKKTPHDYSAFRASKPASILVLPAENHTTDIAAAHSLTSLVTQPLAESGYYVFPVAVVEETFKQNGLNNATDIRSVSTTKLHDIFNADAALYIDINTYGTKYLIVDSETRVTASAKLVDLRSGKQIWSGSATASDNESSNNNQSALGMLIAAAVHQIASNVSDKAHDVAAITSARLLTAGDDGALLLGPRAKAGKI
ncbi:hypothetical protein J3D56_001365 [Erwinia persicina]|uniref:DUF799 domain-containing protein n=1 Tax=Erwinia persicina TaxID=55211 RepID=UPI00209EC1AD|nr:DUF799 domain-containing protein [Erwinia persicina]MCP1437929.1 hypothetical protein [Erwinia persicina]